MKLIIGEPKEIAAYELALKDGKEVNSDDISGIVKELNQKVKAAHVNHTIR